MNGELPRLLGELVKGHYLLERIAQMCEDIATADRKDCLGHMDGDRDTCDEGGEKEEHVDVEDVTNDGTFGEDGAQEDAVHDRMRLLDLEFENKGCNGD
ncbi:Aste57867_21952 [Aphanomyces stellatus]|uniref:Aste57867_21952 protein n=1 Tax=Aphanomyces stellatus TaxID=120398 RepID=A0A485LIW6_9STRA|nr:hypothetical protein As57867_021883 [Aphanomyces stellatus]VFT98620.1 Aste57867_21952 [Aphanomyces stellatus]